MPQNKFISKIFKILENIIEQRISSITFKKAIQMERYCLSKMLFVVLQKMGNDTKIILMTIRNMVLYRRGYKSWPIAHYLYVARKFRTRDTPIYVGALQDYITRGKRKVIFEMERDFPFRVILKN